jgi:hypothetical protein
MGLFTLSRPGRHQAMCCGPGRAVPARRAWGKAQARPTPSGRASPDPLATGRGRAWAGLKKGPRAGLTGSGCMPIYTPSLTAPCKASFSYTK